MRSNRTQLAARNQRNCCALPAITNIHKLLNNSNINK